MDVIDGLMCLGLVGAEAYVLAMALRRNGSVRVRGKADYVPAAIALFLALFFAVPGEGASTLEVLRDVLLYLTILSTLLVKRGFSEEGMAILFVTVPWERMGRVSLEAYQTSRALVRVHAGAWRLRLLFSRHRVAELVGYLAAHGVEADVDERVAAWVQG